MRNVYEGLAALLIEPACPSGKRVLQHQAVSLRFSRATEFSGSVSVAFSHDTAGCVAHQHCEQVIASRNLLALGEKNMCRARKPPLFMLYARKEQNENSLTQVRGSHSAQVIHRYIGNRKLVRVFVNHCSTAFFSLSLFIPGRLNMNKHICPFFFPYSFQPAPAGYY